MFQCMAHYHQTNKGNLSRDCHLTSFNAKGSHTVQSPAKSAEMCAENTSSRGAQWGWPPDGNIGHSSLEHFSVCHKGLQCLRIIPNRAELRNDSA